MQDISGTDPFINIDFPRRTFLIKRLRHISFVINDTIIFLSLLGLLIWIFNFAPVNLLLFQTLAISPFVLVLFIFSGVALLFGAKRHLINIHKEAQQEDFSWWTMWIPILLATGVALFGLINFVHVTNSGVLSHFSASPFGGLCFFLIGVALIPPYTRILHRFHITQFLIFIVSGLSVFIVLENIYQLFSPLPVQHIVFVPLPTALAFAFICFGILLRWSNRGFFGNFTLDSTVSRFALRLFLINLTSAPFIAFLILILMQKTSYNMYQVLTVVVACFTFLSCLLLWINVKLLYRYDLEYLLMRESLQAHNIDLTTEKEALRKSMAQLEQEKQQYLDKLGTQNTLKEMADSLE